MSSLVQRCILLCPNWYVSDKTQSTELACLFNNLCLRFSNMHSTGQDDQFVENNLLIHCTLNFPYHTISIIWIF